MVYIIYIYIYINLNMIIVLNIKIINIYLNLHFFNSSIFLNKMIGITFLNIDLILLILIQNLLITKNLHIFYDTMYPELRDFYHIFLFYLWYYNIVLMNFRIKNLHYQNLTI